MQCIIQSHLKVSKDLSLIDLLSLIAHFTVSNESKMVVLAKYFNESVLNVETKYLEVKVINKEDIFRDQRMNMMMKAQKMANLANGVIYKSYKKVMIGKLFGKILPYQEYLMEQM